MLLSDAAWKMIDSVYQAIVDHPFNQELMLGILDKDKFAYYIEQDSFYLQDFARCYAIIASKISNEYVGKFLGYASYALITEQEVVHGFFKETFNFKATGLMAPATLSYTNYLLSVCALQPVEVAIAAVLPCAWVYREVGLFIAKNSVANNPYARWIETYASEDFGQVVTEMINIFDSFAANATDAIRKKMLDAFYNSSVFEWHFWNDAYQERVFDAVNLENSTMAFA